MTVAAAAEPAAPTLFLLAGPNGAGKSTLYYAALADSLIPPDAEFVNADLHERAHLKHIADLEARSQAARAWADARRSALLEQRATFVSETVFSHESKLALIGEAQAHGFQVVLMVVCMDHPERLVERVQQRVREGGHHVPAERILSRYPRTLTHLSSAVRLADLALLFDTGLTSDDGIAAPVHVATCRGATTRKLVKPLPQWAKTMLSRRAVH